MLPHGRSLAVISNPGFPPMVFPMCPASHRIGDLIHFENSIIYRYFITSVGCPSVGKAWVRGNRK